MDLSRLLERLEAEAVEKRLANRQGIELRIKPVSRTDANINKIAQLQQKTATMKFELESNEMLAAETKRNQEAALALYRSNRTSAEKKKDDEDSRRMAVHYSSLCAELSPAWREEASIAFRNRKL